MKKIVLFALSSLATSLALSAPAVATVDAPSAFWMGTVYPRANGNWDASFAEKTLWNLRFVNGRDGKLELFRFDVSVPFRCDDGDKGTKVVEFRNRLMEDESHVWFDDDDGVPTLRFTWKHKQDAGWVNVKGRVKLRKSDSNRFEPDARGRLAWGNGECRSLGGAATPMGWVGERRD